MEFIKFEAPITGEYIVQHNMDLVNITSDCWTQIPIMPDVFEIYPQGGIYQINAVIQFENITWFEGDKIGADINKYNPQQTIPPDWKNVGTNKRMLRRNDPEPRPTIECINILRTMKIEKGEAIKLYAYQNSGISVCLNSIKFNGISVCPYIIKIQSNNI